MKKMRTCVECKAYTLQETHCKKNTISAHPAPFNPNDPYAQLRRKNKGIE